MSARRRLALAVIAPTLMVCANVLASETVPSVFSDVVAAAELIVRGRVTDVRVVSGPSRRVETVATVAVDAVLKGERAGFVSVLVPGGTIGRYRFQTVGAPTLRLSDSAVFLLTRQPDGAWRPVGLAAGVYRIERDRASGLAVIRAPILPGRTAPTGRVVRGEVTRRVMSVQEFESLVHLVVARPVNPVDGAAP